MTVLAMHPEDIGAIAAVLLLWVAFRALSKRRSDRGRDDDAG